MREGRVRSGTVETLSSIFAGAHEGDRGEAMDRTEVTEVISRVIRDMA